MASISPSQEKLLEFLKDPESYPHKPDRVEIVQTHASILAIASPFVYKLKKPFDFGFMDFSTLEARKNNGEKEIQLNSRLCKDTYLDLIPVAQQNGQLYFGGDGEIVDYALKMKQLEDGFFLNQLLEKGEADTQTFDSVLQLLKTFYEGQAGKPEILPFGNIAHLRKNTDENFSSLQQLKDSLIAPEALKTIQAYTNTFYKNQKELFAKRIAEGKIKDCHGDLHLEHIHIRNDKICIYDCIEFNDRFRYIDIAADIAFLAMDLDFSQRPALGQYVADKLARLMKDPDLLKLMDFYKSYRSCVRAKVEGIKSGQAEVPEDEKRKSKEKTVRYTQLALRYAIIGSWPMVIVVCGRVGSGKSRLAKRLAELLGTAYISSDIIRKENAGLDPTKPTPPKQKEDLYSEEKTKETYQLLLEKSVQQLKQYQSTVVDATFSKNAQRQNFRKAYKETQIPFCFLETTASEQVLKERLAKRAHKKEVSDARLQDFDLLNQSYEAMEEIPASEFIQLNTEKSPEKTTETALKGIASLRALQ